MVDLDELMKLREAATPGPWKVTDKCAHLYVTDSNPNREIAKIGRKPKAYVENTSYIVAACDAVPELVARIRELEAQLEGNEMRMKRAGDVFTDLLKELHKITDKKEDEEGIPFKQISALEPCLIVSNNNSTPPEWLMRRFTEVK